MELIEERIQLIAKDIQEANASPWTITKIIKELEKLQTRSEKKLIIKVQEMLNELDPAAAQIYAAFNRMKVYTSKGTIQNFNRGNIIQSLLKETAISRSVAEKITIEVENQLKDSKIDFLTPSLIRELVNAKLLSYGFENIRNKYTRLGEPVFDVKQNILKETRADEATKELAFLQLIPKSIREKHFNGTIFIEDVEGFATRPYAYTFICEKESTLEKTIIKNINKIIQNKKYFYLTPNLFGLSFVCAPFIKNNSQTKKTANLIQEMLNIVDGEPIISLELYTPQKLESFSEHKLTAAKLSNELLNKNSVVIIDSKYCLKLIEKKGLNFLILNNSEEEYFPLNNKMFSTSQGIEMFVNINLEKLCDGNEESFFENLQKTAEEIKQLSKIKKELLLEKTYLEKFNLNEMKTAIGITNLFELYKNFENQKPKEFANKVFKAISKEFENFLVFGLGSHIAKERFEKETGKTIYSHEILEFEECLDSKKCCFTGQIKNLKEAYELIDKKVKQIQFIGKN